MKDTVEMRHGEKGHKFYIILKGAVSVWVPVSPQDMIDEIK
jgi:hypothetical protein